MTAWSIGVVWNIYSETLILTLLHALLTQSWIKIKEVISEAVDIDKRTKTRWAQWMHVKIRNKDNYLIWNDAFPWINKYFQHMVHRK